MVVALSLALLPGGPFAGSASAVDNTTRSELPLTTLVAQHSGKCLDVYGWSTSDGGPIYQYGCKLGTNQNFGVRPIGTTGGGDTIFEIANENSGKCFDFPKNDNGTALYQWTCHRGGQQQFVLARLDTAQPAGVFQLKHVSSGKCIDIGAWSTADRADVVLWPCGATQGNQRFKLRAFLHAGLQPFFDTQKFQVGARGSLEVNLTTGNLMYSETDLNLSGTGLGLEISRYWNSRGYPRRSYQPASFGPGWTLNWGADVNQSLIPTATGAHALMRLPGGGQRVYWDTGVDALAVPPGATTTQVTKTSDYALKDLASKTTVTYGGPYRSISRMADAYGNNISVNYQTNRQLSSLTDTRGRSVPVTYTSTDVNAGRISSIADWSGRTISYTYDTSGRLAGAGNTAHRNPTRFGYDTRGRITSVTDPRGNTITIAYDGLNRATSITQPGSVVTQFRYAQGVVGSTSGTDQDNLRCLGILAETPPPPAGTVNSTTVVNAMNERLRVGGDGFADAYCYDGDYRVTRQVGMLADTIDVGYDALANERNVGFGTLQKQFGFDARSRATSATSPTGAVGRAAYGDAAHPFSPTSSTDDEGRQTTYAYDSNGAPIRVTDPAGNATSYVYNADGTLASETDPRGNTTTYGYTGGLLTSVTPPSPLGRTTYAHDSLGRVTRVTDGRGNVTTTSYTPADEPATISFADGTSVAYTYDQNGNTTIVTPSGGTSADRRWAYDALNQVTSETLPNGQVIGYGYDKMGRLTSRSEDGATTSYLYSRGLLSQIVEPTACTGCSRTCSNNPDCNRTTFFYYGSGANVSLQPAQIQYPNGINVDYAYDNADRVVKMEAWKSGTSTNKFLNEVSYRTAAGVDTSKIQTSTLEVAGQTTRISTYTYDAASRLTRHVEKDPAGTVLSDWSFGYDAAGNRTLNNGTTSTYNAANQQTAAGSTVTFNYDANGNRTARNNYNSSTGVTTSETATYNAKNQTTSLSPLSSIGYSGSSQQELASLGSDAVESGMLGVTQVGGDSFLRGPNGALVSMTTAGASHYYIRDVRGSVIGTTDGPGNVSATYRYDSWGQLRHRTGTVSSRMKFNGELNVDASKYIYKIGHRYYDARSGRWTQTDPSRQEPNTYAYAMNDPVNNQDPSGLLTKMGCGVISWLAGMAAGYGLTGSVPQNQPWTPGMELAVFGAGMAAGSTVTFWHLEKKKKVCDDPYSGPGAPLWAQVARWYALAVAVAGAIVKTIHGMLPRPSNLLGANGGRQYAMTSVSRSTGVLPGNCI